MQTIAVVLVLLGVLCMAGHAVTQRWVLREKVLGKGEVLILQNSIATLFLLSAMFWWHGMGTEAHSVNPRLFWIAVLGTTVFNVFIQYANAKSRELADASLSAPIQAMTPALVTIAALTLGEYPSLQGIIGIAFIAVGTYIHSREGARTFAEYLQPFYAMKLPTNLASLTQKEQQQARDDRTALLFAYGSAGAGTFGLIFDGLVARNGNVAEGFFFQLLLLTFVFSAMQVTSAKKEAVITPLSVRAKMYWLPIGAIGILYGLHVLFVMTAFRVAPIAYIGSMKRLSIMLIILLSWMFLGETKAKKRLWPAGIITLGAILLAFDGSIARLVDNANMLLQ